MSGSPGTSKLSNANIQIFWGTLVCLGGGGGGVLGINLISLRICVRIFHGHFLLRDAPGSKHVCEDRVSPRRRMPSTINIRSRDLARADWSSRT